MQKLNLKVKNNRITFYFLLIFLTFNFLLLTFPVRAQQVSLSLSPPLLKLFIKPGKTIMVAYQLKNLGDPTFLNLKLLPFEAKDNLGNIRIKDEFSGPVRFSLDNADLQLGKTFFLKTNDSQQILLRIRIPENIPDGDFYYSLLAETLPPTETEGIGSARASATIGSNILITISNAGDVDIKPQIVIFNVLSRLRYNLFNRDVNLFDSTDKIPVVLTIANKGKNLMTPQGEITLKGNLGESAQYDIVPKNILAQSERLMEATPSAELNCDNGHNEACLSPKTLTLSGFFIGNYSLSTQITFGENSPTIFASTSFFAFPFKIVFGIILSVGVVIFIIRRFRDD